eukprot:gene8106-1641_t
MGADERVALQQGAVFFPPTGATADTLRRYSFEGSLQYIDPELFRRAGREEPHVRMVLQLHLGVRKPSEQLLLRHIDSVVLPSLRRDGARADDAVSAALWLADNAAALRGDPSAAPLLDRVLGELPLLCDVDGAGDGDAAALLI